MDLSFTNADFNIFNIDGLEQRMDAIKSTIRPKLEYLGQELTPYLNILTGTENYYHVAKHARRTVNPPNDTWVAWSSSKRGYKSLPHFQVGLWSTHLFVWFAMIYEAPNKELYGERIQDNVNEIIKTIPSHFVWSVDHTKPEVIPHKDLNTNEIISMANRLQNVKKAELLCGITIDSDDSILLNGNQLIKKIEDTFNQLSFLYQIATPAKN